MSKVSIDCYLIKIIVISSKSIVASSQPNPIQIRLGVLRRFANVTESNSGIFAQAEFRLNHGYITWRTVMCALPQVTWATHDNQKWNTSKPFHQRYFGVLKSFGIPRVLGQFGPGPKPPVKPNKWRYWPSKVNVCKCHSAKVNVCKGHSAKVFKEWVSTKMCSQNQPEKKFMIGNRFHINLRFSKFWKTS